MSAESTPPANPACKNKIVLALGGCGLLAVGLLLGFALDRPHPPRFAPHPQPREQAGPPHGQRPPMGGPRQALRQEMRERGSERRGDIQKWAEPMDKIRDKYRGEIAKVLRPEQKAKLEDQAENREGRRGPGGPGQLLGVVLIAPQLDRITGHLVLDDAQKKQVEAILKKQRDEVLAWLDANPPPKLEGRPRRALGMQGPHPHGDGPGAMAAHFPGGPRQDPLP